jgi:hypothetical protein
MKNEYYGGARRACTTSEAAHREWEPTRLADALHRDRPAL